MDGQDSFVLLKIFFILVLLATNPCREIEFKVSLSILGRIYYYVMTLRNLKRSFQRSGCQKILKSVNSFKHA